MSLIVIFEKNNSWKNYFSICHILPATMRTLAIVHFATKKSANPNLVMQKLCWRLLEQCLQGNCAIWNKNIRLLAWFVRLLKDSSIIYEMEVARICWHSCIIRKNSGLRFSSLRKMAWKWRRWRNSILLFMAYCTLMFARPTISGQGKTSKYIHSTSLMFSVCAFYIIYMFI